MQVAIYFAAVRSIIVGPYPPFLQNPEIADILKELEKSKKSEKSEERWFWEDSERRELIENPE